MPRKVFSVSQQPMTKHATAETRNRTSRTITALQFSKFPLLSYSMLDVNSCYYKFQRSRHVNEDNDSFSIVLTHPPNLHVAVNNRSFVFRFNYNNSTILTSEINMERGGRKEIRIGVSTNLTSIVGYQELE